MMISLGTTCIGVTYMMKTFSTSGSVTSCDQPFSFCTYFKPFDFSAQYYWSSKRTRFYRKICWRFRYHDINVTIVPTCWRHIYLQLRRRSTKKIQEPHRNSSFLILCWQQSGWSWPIFNILSEGCSQVVKKSWWK